MPNSRVNITETLINEYTTDMDLVIKTLHKRDFGEYTCVSENTIGRAEGKIRLHGNMLHYWSWVFDGGAYLVFAFTDNVVRRARTELSQLENKFFPVTNFYEDIERSLWASLVI